MVTTLRQRVRDLLTLAILGVLLPAGANAAGLTITPATVPADYAEKITLNVSGLTLGQTVMVETFLDYGGDGTINSGDPMIQCFMLTDGEAAAIEGVRNVNVPGDDDGMTDGKIRTLLRPQAFPEIARGIASYLYKVSPVTGSFTPVAAIFEITQLPDTATTGKVTGTAKNKNDGSPVPFVYVFLVTPNAGGPIVGALTDLSGKFTLTSEMGTYMLGAVKNGFLFDFVTAPLAQIIAHGTVTRDLSLTAADATISGRLTDLESGAGIPGVQMTAESGDPGMLGLAFSDADGYFTIPVSTAATEWGVDASRNSAGLLGYLSLDGTYPVGTGGGNVSIRWPKATALVYGTLKDDQVPPQPLAGVTVETGNDQYNGFGFTDSSGTYVAGAGAGDWWVGPSSDDLGARGYFAQGAPVTLNAGQAVQQDLTARQPTARLIGRVTDEDGHPIRDACILTYTSQGGYEQSTTTDAAGNFSLGVLGGFWSLQLCSETAQQRGLVRSTRSFEVTDGVDIENIQYPVRQATAQITGRVTDGTTSAPLAGVGVAAHIMVDGVSYDPWQETDADGQYSLGVFNGTWQVSPDCDDLQSRGYRCPTPVPVPISGANRVANFAVWRADAQCLGDCDRNHVMSPGELVTLVSIALGPGDITPCNGTPGEPVTVDQIVRVWNGCPG